MERDFNGWIMDSCRFHFGFYDSAKSPSLLWAKMEKRIPVHSGFLC